MIPSPFGPETGIARKAWPLDPEVLIFPVTNIPDSTGVPKAVFTCSLAFARDMASLKGVLDFIIPMTNEKMRKMNAAIVTKVTTTQVGIIHFQLRPHQPGGGA